MKKFISIFLLISFPLLCFSYPLIPDVKKTPGAYCTLHDRDFDEYRYYDRIAHCKRNVSTKTKDEVCRSYGVFDRRDYTVDHLIPLSLGGSNHVCNLWCQNKAINSSGIEYYLYTQVRDGLMGARDAIEQLLTLKFDPDSI